METNNHYEIFSDNCFNLAETIVMKSEYSAKALNNYLQYSAPGTFDPNDPKTWKYYLNLAGEYYLSDEVMIIQSVDTQETIVFNKENLRLHRATAREYRYGTKLYKELLALYPEQEQLILGILYPIDIDKAIEAEDWTILGYAPEFVESNEYSLISDIEAFIKRFVSRWHIKGYRLIDENYEVAFFGQVALLLPALINKLRLDRAKTNQAHSFHIRQYLASNLGLDRYFDVMNLEQRLWFYRNIRYINRNAGHSTTFETLIENIMSKRHLALTSYTMAHDVEKVIEELSSKPIFKREPKNRYVSTTFSEPIDLETLLDKEDRLAKDNVIEKEDNAEDIDFTFRHALANIGQTKVLESAMYDYSDATPFPFSDILMNHWPYLANLGIYRAFVRITNPRTGDIIPLSVKDAYVLAQYLLLHAYGVTLDEVQPVICRKVQVIPFPSTQDILKMTSGKYFDEEFVEDLVQYNPELTDIISTDSYWEKCRDIFTALRYQRNRTAFEEHFVKRGEVQGMSARLYGVKLTYLEPAGTKYSNWFNEKGIDIADFPEEQFELIYVRIVEQALGLDVRTTQSLSNLQNLMINMFSELSSYSIQFLKEINDNPIKIIEWPAIRLGDINAEAESQAYYVDMALDFFNMEADGKQNVHYDISEGFRYTNAKIDGEHNLKYCLSKQFNISPQKDFSSMNYNIHSPGFSMQLPRKTLYPNGQFPLPGIDTTFNILTEEQKRSLPDMYQDDWWNTVETPMVD
ncbi:MAG: hypothetical protein M0R77_00445 [Gammaproteobacteria bacterium]|nr:hypothetical protein [Acholeplasmataceae bacterium]MCK9529023.1 hypothetical protein [Gammaproteobacteria bacterium]